MKTLYFLLALALLAGPAQAGTTSVAQVPLLNITGTGTVKPNLMLLYDNSGSMASSFTPDYIDDATSCRSGATMADAGGPRSCKVGYPPFNSADFNKQFYNPKVLYSPPVYADGSSYQVQNRANTSTWAQVSTDPWGRNASNLTGTSVATTNLVTGFPDVKWCDPSNTSNCGFNSATYSYPDNLFTKPVNFTTNAYYFTINVAEYCSDASMTSCTQTAVGAPAPVNYPVPAKVRWCDSTALTNCQAKYVGNFIYPRYSNPNGGLVAAYGSITINSSSGSNAVSISSVTLAESGGNVVITNGPVPAASGTNNATKQATLATDLALSIINKTGLSNQYTACVRTPTGSNSAAVPLCSAYGITLATNNMVAVIPIDCSSAATSKAIGQCSVLPDSTRSGWAIVVASPTLADPATALLSIAGKTNTGSTPVLASMSLGGVALFGGTALSLSKGVLGPAVASAIAAKINASGVSGISAYVGPNPVSVACSTASTSSVCVVNTAAVGGGAAILMGALSNNVGAGGTSSNGTIVFSTSTATVPVNDTVPTTSVPLSAGNAVFVRTDIVASRNSYPKDINRSDCAASACSYDEEMTNFANWYTYYKTRNQMMKTSVGLAFKPITANYKVGIVALSVAAAEGTITPPMPFSGQARADWYDTLYDMTGSNSTPLRQALHAVGKMYANLAPYVAAAGSEVVQFPCQQNFTFMTTDGYWNGGAAATVVSNDNVSNAARFCTRARGCLDPATQSANSLADVALYWYNGGSNLQANPVRDSLRPSLEDWSKPGLVPAAAGDNTRLHMNTYTLGLGVDGIMNYEPHYDTAPVVGGDFYKLITGVASACPWNGNGAYNWPDPMTGDSSGSAAYQSRVDDLWHAAINGRGKYFSASDPSQVVAGLSAALANIEVKIGAAAAAATSTPNISQQDNDIFSDTFTTVKWYGELSDKKIDTVTGVVGSSAVWNSSDMVGRKVAAASDTRTITMLDTGNGTLKDFKYSAMTSTEKAWFDNKCTALSQCASISAADRIVVNGGANIVDWLRGQQQYANDSVLRAYTPTNHNPPGLTAPIPIVLGDIASSKPAFMREPRKGYSLAGYNQFVVDNANRAATVFAAANDGMLHAFSATTGEELWAYVPRITMQKLHLQASTTYGTNHQFSTDGSPELGDVKIGSTWKTILVAGLNGGGRGYYAIDVTNPAAPAALWELCADGNVCSGANQDADLGLSFGNPQFGMWQGQWVVYLTSGYNNINGSDGVSGGNGGAYLYIVDVSNGHVLRKVAAGTASTATPPGLAKITAISSDPVLDPVTTYIYGGDNQGQMWRFDLTDAAGAVVVNKMGNAGSLQPITTRPEVTTCKVPQGNGFIAQRVVLFGTGRLLDVVDVGNVDVQSVYMLKDTATEVAAWRGSGMVQQTLTKIGSGVNANSFSVSNNLVDLSLAATKGWYVDFDKNGGERVNLDPKVVAGGVNVVSNMPSSSSACSVGGTSNVYQLNACSGSFIDPNSDGTQQTTLDANGNKVVAHPNGADVVAGSTLSNTSAAVGFIIIRLPSGALKMVTTTADGATITSGVQPAITLGTRKVGWRRVTN
ncbi:MAG: PilC/PilY family type IV pilus protein [Pseudomonadota bacterium]